MQYLTRTILSSFLPGSVLQSRRTRVLLIAAGACAVVILTILLLRGLGSADISVPDELGLKPLHATDENGARWSIEPAVGQPFARLRENQVEPGAPLTIRTDVQRRGGRELSIGLSIEGRAGERYRPDITKNGVLLPAPQFTVVNVAGRVVFQGKFEYG